MLEGWTHKFESGDTPFAPYGIDPVQGDIGREISSERDYGLPGTRRSSMKTV